MNYTELNEYQKSEVLTIILEDCEEMRWEYPNANDLAEMYSTKDIQELIRGHWLNEELPEDLVMDWDEFLIDYWKEYPEGYFVWMMKETAEEMEIYERTNDIPHHP